MTSRTALVVLASLAFVLSGCRKEEIVTYRVAKEKPAEPAAVAAGQAPMPMPAGASAQAAMANTPLATSTGPDLMWIAPSHWKPGPPAQMRKATYFVPGGGGTQAELAISAFGGEVGGELGNVNRWRGQPPFSLPPISAAELSSVVTRQEHNGLKFGIVEIVSNGNTHRLLGAWVPFAGSTWFFKFSGPDAIMAKEKAAFEAFVASVKPAAASGTP